MPIQEQLTQSLFDHIPVGVGSKGIIPATAPTLIEALELGMDWSLREGYSWAEDKEHCEEYGRMLSADPSCVSQRAKKRGAAMVVAVLLLLMMMAVVVERTGANSAVLCFNPGQSAIVDCFETLCAVAVMSCSLVCRRWNKIILGLPQLGTLGAGNHYAEVQVVDEIFDPFAARKMGIERKGGCEVPRFVPEVSVGLGLLFM